MRRKLRALALSVGVVGAFAAVAATPALAEEVAAKASAANITLSATNITVKKNGAEAKNCELAGVNGKIEGSIAWIKPPTFSNETVLTCAGGTKFGLGFYPSVLFYDTVAGQYKMRTNPGGTPLQSPWGNYTASPSYPVGVWTNGSGATHSTIKFSETIVGKLSSGADISFSGTFTAKTNTGGLITLSH